MASSETTEVPAEMPSDLPSELPFPPLTKSHILNCSFHSWYPQYRSITPKTRLIPLSAPFLAYLRADGIITPPDAPAARTNWSDSDSGIYSSADNDNSSTHSDESETVDPSEDWPEIHAAVRSTIQELGGKVVPKLNWSAPKDATWISPMNSLECRTPNDIYLLLKASDFVTHDLEHAFDDTVPDDKGPKAEDIPYHLVLRKHFLWNSSIEFRCFVRKRKIIGICQRDLNHYDFLFDMRDNLGRRIQEFFESKIKDTFPDDNFVLDVYVPPPYERVWLVDVNPWARRTDPLLFSWLELLTMPEPDAEAQRTEDDKDREEEEDSEDDADEEIWIPEFRLVKKDDPEAYSFASPQYSAHKLPLEVVNAASGNPGNLAEFASQWQELLAKQQQQAEESSSDEE